MSQANKPPRRKTLMTRACPYCGKQTKRSEDRCEHCQQPLPKELQWWVYAMGGLIVLMIGYLVVDWSLWARLISAKLGG